MRVSAQENLRHFIFEENVKRRFYWQRCVDEWVEGRDDGSRHWRTRRKARGWEGLDKGRARATTHERREYKKRQERERETVMKRRETKKKRGKKERAARQLRLVVRCRARLGYYKPSNRRLSGSSATIATSGNSLDFLPWRNYTITSFLLIKLLSYCIVLNIQF